MLTIRAAMSTDRDDWAPLWAGYLTFYETNLTPDITDATWQRIIDDDGEIHSILAFEGSTCVGFAHYLFHPSTWSKTNYCYLEDLFVSQEARGQGVATALIQAVADKARAAQSDRFYWTTHDTNIRAQSVYDKIANNEGFIIYRKDL